MCLGCSQRDRAIKALRDREAPLRAEIADLREAIRQGDNAALANAIELRERDAKLERVRMVNGAPADPRYNHEIAAVLADEQSREG